jgi:signal transduction histidine kinase
MARIEYRGRHVVSEKTDWPSPRIRLRALIYASAHDTMAEALCSQPFLGTCGDQRAVFEVSRVESIDEMGGALMRHTADSEIVSVAVIDAPIAPMPDVVKSLGELLAASSTTRVILVAPTKDPAWAGVLRELGDPARVVQVEAYSAPALRQWIRALSAPVLSEIDSTEGCPSRERDTKEVRRPGAERPRHVDTKLEAVGRLAAGLAHEINTPVQFVNDSVFFLEDAFDELRESFDWMRGQFGADAPVPERECTRMSEHLHSDDLSFVLEQVPPAFSRVRDGLDRIIRIVHAMREFAPGRNAETPRAADLNRAIENTLVVAKNEYKYIADVETRLGELPQVECFIHDINQVLLNLVVNAAHAIETDESRDRSKGTITIETRVDGGEVVIAIGDDGCGIDPEITDRIFEPFFTTKPVGSGTGQGLALARAVVEKRHHGRLHFESKHGEGTTFFVTLPVKAMCTDDPAEEGLRIP